MSTYSRMQLLQLVENQQMSPEEALRIIRENSRRPASTHQVLTQQQPQAAASPILPLNRLLAEGVAALLKIPEDRIHPDADWRSFGFDSISFTAFHSYLTEKLGISFPLDVFFDYSTINRLSGFLLARAPDREPGIGSNSADEAGVALGFPPDLPAPEETFRALEHSLWLVNSADRFFADAWRQLTPSGAQSARAGSRPLSRNELEQVPHQYIQLLVGTSDGQKMEAVISGQGKPLVIVGGVGMASPMILHQLDYFSRHRRVISIHNPGCGLSEEISDYSLEHRVRVIAEVLDQLGADGAVDFVGISWGGLIGQTFSVMYPQRVSNLILVSSIYEIVNENPQLNADTAMRKDLEAVEHGLEAMELLEAGKSIDNQIFTKYMEYYLPGNHKSYSTAGLIRRIQVPVLIVYGTRDTIIQNRQSTDMADAIPGARCVELKDAAHFLFMTHHEQLNRVIDEFIGRPAPACFRLEDIFPDVIRMEQHRLAELDIKGIEGYAGLEERLNKLCMSYAYRYLKQAGICTDSGTIHDRREWVKQLNILPAYIRLLDCMIDMLEEDGVVKRLNSRIKFIKPEAEIPSAQALYEACTQDYPAFQGMLQFLDYCTGNYKEALSGKVPPVSVLFPGGSADALEQSNRDTVEHGRERAYAGVVHDILTLLIKSKEGKGPVNILEVGGGTGLLTRQLLDLAELPNVNYWFTDIGEYFITRAKGDPDFSALHYKILDISRNPAEQGFAPDSFDAVIGLNVVHATRNIGSTLDNLQQVLVPGGLMLLIEACTSRRWVDMVWGLAEGWWLFEDRNLRTRSPIIDPYAWEQAVSDAGYRDVRAFPQDDERRFTADCILVTGHKR
ncbi:alpha/beta fold hydrolase [Paenibacillus piscarius]|uniref:alpha/beta fold hydrolase n=1 Tax=Paenibacillus piscarius TaxID=1089681 RepID=UPI001EE8C024|nr:alpha/beta fold hydrolase [Paenibacillus piscarius]